MPFVQSLICWQGADNRQRFSLIIAACHLVFIFSCLLFPSSSVIQATILLLALITIVCATKRRLNDSKLTKQWLFVPGSVFLLMGLIIMAIDGASMYWLSIFPLTTAAVLLTYPSKSACDYIFGYCGPVDLTTAQTSRRPRIEPQLNAQLSSIDNSIFEQVTQANNNAYTTHDNTIQNNNATDIGEQIRNQLLNNKNAKITLITLLLTVIMAMLVTYLITGSEKHLDEATDTETKLTSTEQITKQRENPLVMPDDFTLYSSVFNGLIINWQADTSDKQNLWDIRQANGDVSCQQITFNNQDTVRTTLVTVENSNHYFAEFSPLDTEKLVKSLAARGSFMLCGYSFSLKGSQATLGKHVFYGELLAN